MKYRTQNSGFTLVELIIVVIVIGILAAVGMPQYNKAIEKARGAEASAGIQNIQQGQKLYFASNEKYFNPGSGTAGGELQATQDKTLDISLPRKGWKFHITDLAAPSTSASTWTSYRIKAERSAGACTGTTTIFDNNGNLINADGSSATKSAWEVCQEGL